MKSYKKSSSGQRGRWLDAAAFLVAAFLVVVIALATLPLAMAAAEDSAAPEAIPAPQPFNEPSNDVAAGDVPSGGDATGRIVDFFRFLFILCDDHPVPVPLLPQQAIASLSAHVSPEGIALLEKRLQDPEALALIRRRAPEASQLLPLFAALAPLAHEMHPEVQVVFARQDIAEIGAIKPCPVLPGVAIIFQPNNVAEAKSRLLTTYIALLASINKLADQDGVPRFTMQSGMRGNAFFASVRPLDPTPSQLAAIDPLRYNFTPAIGVAGNRFIISTTAKLGGELVDLALGQADTTESIHGPRLDLGPGATAGLVLDNLLTRFDAGQPNRPALATALNIARQALDNMPQRPRRIPNIQGRVRNRLGALSAVDF